MRYLLSAFLFALPAAAQEGEVSLDGQSWSVTVTNVTASTDTAVNRMVIEAEGKDGASLQVTIGPYGDEMPDRAQIEWAQGETAWIANADTGGQLRLTDVTRGENTISLTFGGLVVPAEIIPGGALAPVAAGKGVEIGGHLRDVPLPK